MTVSQIFAFTTVRETTREAIKIETPSSILNDNIKLNIYRIGLMIAFHEIYCIMYYVLLYGLYA